MAEVTIEIAGRSYRVGCAPGEEEHLASLAHRIDAEAEKLQRGMGALPETRLLLMSALMVSDRLSDAQKQIVRLEQKLAELERKAGDAPEESAAQAEREAELATALDRIAERLETLTDTVHS
ncbi:MAG: cell division protein ZapA [Pseudomonadota bacterium]